MTTNAHQRGWGLASRTRPSGASCLEILLISFEKVKFPLPLPLGFFKGNPIVKRGVSYALSAQNPLGIDVWHISLHFTVVDFFQNCRNYISITCIDPDGERDISYKTKHIPISFSASLMNTQARTTMYVFRSRHCRSVVVLTTKSTFGAPLSQPMFFFEITMNFC